MKSKHHDSTTPVRERILKTTHDLFYKNGIRATGVNQIIKESGVTKVTLYRHFSSKNNLIRAYLEYRHKLWIEWFVGALKKHHKGNSSFTDSLVETLREWFESDGYRGCAFINAVVEMDGVLPEFTDISKRHKEEVVNLIADLLPDSEHCYKQAFAIAVAMDGAIFRAQLEKETAHALESFKIILNALNSQNKHSR